ncbi:CDP-alcohol phosphatidyltransferase family protein [Acuticoccus sp. M5D2P5]|uniref:CDP-alcohol phosphatidyltransferase family protein n=1 Tax=Acuticoccus kalidii TaxID=2910977 RepID=UPI001F21C117|nr:CDP-alcohol phosphatidyltransferase family protein [Acuticoccus kalidii]MCF3933641.1 CDP-alcohol phosphatidyltransferase family protein [Acuticoccus kalidii]
MFDSQLRPLIDPPLDRLARRAIRFGLSADQVTFAGLLVGLAAAFAIGAGIFWLALLLILLNRLADGLDGAIARRTEATDRGAYFDIVFDFLFYGAVPLAFAFHDPIAYALPAAILLASFYANGATFLGFSAIAAKRGITTAVQGRKGIYYFAGIAEGAETIGVFVAMTIFPAFFSPIALAFAIVCFVSAAARIVLVWALLGEDS